MPLKKRLLSICFFKALLVHASLHNYFLGASMDTLQFCIEQLSLSFVDEFESLVDADLDKFRRLFGNDIGGADDVLKKLENNEIFDKIFEIVE